MKNFIFILFLCLVNTVQSDAQGSLSTGLVLYLPFNGNTLDMSGNGNNATNYGATLTTDAAGNPNSAYLFNGSSDYMKILNSTSLQCDSQISLCAKVKPLGYWYGPCYGNSIIQKGAPDYQVGNYSLRFSSPAGLCSYYDSSTQNYYGSFYSSHPSVTLINTLPRIVSNSWDCVVFTFDGDSAKMYVNSTLRYKFKSSSLIGKNTADVFLGHFNSTTYSYWFKGVMDDVRIYKRALSASEVNSYCGFSAPTNTIKANFKDSSTSCLTKQFTDSSTVTSTGIKLWFWDFGDAGASTLKNPAHTYSAAGSYTVKLIVVDSNGYADTFAKTIYVGIPTIRFANAGNDTTVCKVTGGVNILLNATGGLTYSWTPTTGLSSPSIPNPIATITAPIQYVVTVKNADGCVDKDTIKINIFEGFAKASNDTTVCNLVGGTNILLKASGGLSYSWTPSGGLSNPSISNPIATIIAPINYIVTVTNALGCQEKDTVKINIDEGFANAGNDTTICMLDGLATTTLFASGGTSYSWSPTLGLSNPSIAKPIATFTAPVSYVVTVTNSRGCVESDTINLNTYRFAKANNDTTICLINGIATFNLSANGGISYKWSPNIGLSDSAISNPMATILSNTTYIVKVTDTNGCIDKDTVVLNIDPIDVKSSLKNASGCLGQIVNLSASGAVSYEWLPAADFDNNKIANPKLTISGANKYVVIGKSPLGCTDSDTISITLKLSEDIIIASPDTASGCVGKEIQLSVTGAKNYKWYPSSGLDKDDIANPLLTVVTSAQYVVIGTDSAGCTSSDTINVTKFPSPNVKATSNGDPATCEKVSTTLSATGADFYKWSPDIYCETSESANTKVFPPSTLVFTVSGTNAYGCVGQDTVTVFYKGKTVVHVPNTFSPNGDGINDKIKPIIVCDFILESFAIYNRWGNLIYNTDNPNNPWDGSSEGKPCNLGVYFYLLKGKNNLGESVLMKGDIMLIR